MLLGLANSANSSFSDRQPMASPLINPENMLAIDIIDAYKADRHNSLSSNQTDPDQEHKPPAGWSQCVYLAMTRICLSDLEDNARREIHAHAPVFARLVCTLVN